MPASGNCSHFTSRPATLVTSQEYIFRYSDTCLEIGGPFNKLLTLLRIAEMVVEYHDHQT